MDIPTTGSLLIDLIIFCVAILAAIYGYRQGLFTAALSFLGVIAGGSAGIFLIPPLLRFMDSQGYTNDGFRFMTVIIILAVLVIVCYGLGTTMGTKLRNALWSPKIMTLDSIAGAGMQAMTTLIILWLMLVPTAGNNHGYFGNALTQSKGLHVLNDVMPEWAQSLPTRITGLLNSSGFPVITNPLERLPKAEVAVPDPALQASPVVQRSQESVLKVNGRADQCKRVIQGSSFVVAPNVLMTNAHVVAGTNKVSLETKKGKVPATVTYYNPDVDIAILHAPEVTAPPLQWATGAARQGNDAIVLGYPQNGPYTALPARVRERIMISGPTIYAEGRVKRETYSLRSSVKHGNSGGPLINKEGEVLGLIFGADLKEEDTGYALTKKEVFSEIGSVEKWKKPVDTGRCTKS